MAQGVRKAFLRSCSFGATQTRRVWSFGTLLPAVGPLPLLLPLPFSKAKDYLLVLARAGTHHLGEHRKGMFLPYLLVYTIKL